MVTGRHFAPCWVRFTAEATSSFFEKNVSVTPPVWRNLPSPDCCDLRLYNDWQEVLPDVRSQLSEADVAMVGSFPRKGLPP